MLLRHLLGQLLESDYIENGKMDNPKQTTKELIAEAEKIRNSLKYVYREEKSQYDRLINIQQELFERTVILPKKRSSQK